MNKILVIALWVFLLSSTNSQAHDDGHGPKLTDVGIFGGVISAVVDSAQANLGTKAKLIYKAELVRNDEGIARVYLYDGQMKLLPLEGRFNKLAKAFVISVDEKGKYVSQPFSLELKGKSFVGKVPQPLEKPFNIDVYIKEISGKKLLVAFDRLD